MNPQSYPRLSLSNSAEPMKPLLINTPLQRGGTVPGGPQNRFNGFSSRAHTVETASTQVCPRLTPLKRRVNEKPEGAAKRAFTLLECLLMAAVLGLIAVSLLPGLTRARPASKAIQCQNNLRQLTSAWRQWSDDHQDWLVTCQNDFFDPNVRPNWMTGNLDYNGLNRGNYDPAPDVTKGPLFAYSGKAPSLFRCPADESYVTLSNAWNAYPAGSMVLRVRGYSMNQAFARGEWLGDRFRLYQKATEIVLPARTFVLIDEHPGSINDGAFATICLGNQPSDPPASAKLIDLPANRHDCGAGVTFADGHVEIHIWRNSWLRTLSNTNGYHPALNIACPPGSDPVTFAYDAHWLAERTTVAK